MIRQYQMATRPPELCRIITWIGLSATLPQCNQQQKMWRYSSPPEKPLKNLKRNYETLRMKITQLTCMSSLIFACSSQKQSRLTLNCRRNIFSDSLRRENVQKEQCSACKRSENLSEKLHWGLSLQASDACNRYIFMSKSCTWYYGTCTDIVQGHSKTQDVLGELLSTHRPCARAFAQEAPGLSKQKEHV